MEIIIGEMGLEILEPTACTELIPKSWLCVYSVHALTFWVPDIEKIVVYRKHIGSDGEFSSLLTVCWKRSTRSNIGGNK